MFRRRYLRHDDGIHGHPPPDVVEPPAVADVDSMTITLPDWDSGDGVALGERRRSSVTNLRGPIPPAVAKPPTGSLTTGAVLADYPIPEKTRVAIEQVRRLPTTGEHAIDREFGIPAATVAAFVPGQTPLFHTVEAWSSDTVRVMRSQPC